MLSRNEERSPSLLSIPEENGDQEHPKLPQAMPSSKNTPDTNGIGSEDERQTSVDITDVAHDSPSMSFPPIRPTNSIRQAATDSPTANQVEPQIVSPDSDETPDHQEQTGEESPSTNPSDPIENGLAEVGSSSSNPVETLLNRPEQTDGAHITPPPIELPPTPFVVSQNKQLDSEDRSPREIVSPVEGPSINVLPATPGTSLKNRGGDPFDRPANDAKTTAIDNDNGHSQIKSRKTVSPIPERPITPSSMRSAGKEAKSKNFLKAFLRLIFVDWIGGLIMRLCGGDRRT